MAWRGRLRWIALAGLGPLALFGVAVVAARLVDGAWPALDRFGASTEYAALPAALIVAVVWAAWHVPLIGITPTYRAMPAVGFAGSFLSLLVGALVLATPSTTSLIPMLMGAVLTVAGLPTIPFLIRTRPAEVVRR